MENKKRETKPSEMLLWSIALPGFGQILNGRFFKGVVLIALEFLINVKANLNSAIISSFHLEIEKAIEQTDYLWLMFYPCVYMFAVWDAYKDAGGGGSYGFLPPVFAAYFGTIGVIYSPLFLGPVWLPILLMIVGALIGLLLRMLNRSASFGK
jgi:hypothetical protein